MQTRGFNLASKCQGCSSSETINHIFIQCSLAKQVWEYFSSMFHLQLPEVSCSHLMIQFWKTSSSCASKNHIRHDIPILVLWFLWRERNESRYKGTAPTKHRVIARVTTYIQMTRHTNWKGDFQLGGNSVVILMLPLFLHECRRWHGKNQIRNG